MDDRPGRAPAKYRVIADHFRAQIEAGRLAADDQLPSQDEIGAGFEASGGTVVRALEELRRAGLVETRHGAGTFVLPRRPPEPDVSGELAELRERVEEVSGLAAGGGPELLERVGRIEANLMDLFGKLGYEYPREEPARQERRERQAAGG